MLGSDEVLQAVEAFQDQLSALFSKYILSEESTLQQQQRDGMGLRRFLEMVRDAGLIGSQLSRARASVAFASSLPSKTGNVPLLKPGAEFEEAVVRLSRAFVPSTAKEGRKESLDQRHPSLQPGPEEQIALVDKIVHVSGKLSALLAPMEA